MPKKKKPGIFERARRGVAKATTGETGFGTTLKRGIALISSLAQEATFPTKNVPSRASIQSEHRRKLATKSVKKKAQKKKSDTKRNEKAKKRREPFKTESQRRLEGIQALTKSAAKRAKG